MVLSSLDDDQQGAKAILSERGVLTDARAVLALEFLEQGVAQHPLALAVDEDEALVLLAAILVHRLAEHVELIVEHIAIAHTVGIVERSWFCQPSSHRNRRLLRNDKCGDIRRNHGTVLLRLSL